MRIVSLRLSTERKRICLILLTLFALICILTVVNDPQFIYANNGTQQTSDQLISQDQQAIASSVESVLVPPEAAVDGDSKTRWASAWGSNSQWLAIDFGRDASIKSVELQWDTAYALQYQIQISTDGVTWTTIYTQDQGKGGTEWMNVSGQGRYIRLYGKRPATQHGYSLWEFKVYGQIDDIMPTSTAVLTSTPTSTAEPTSTSTQVLPTPTSTPTTGSTGGGSGPSGQAMPIGDIPGWHQIFKEDFKTDVPVGSFPGTVYGNEFTVYPDGTPDTAGQQGAPSRYYPSKVVSVSNGLLNLYLHTEHGTPMAAAILPTLNYNHLYGKYTIRFRSDALNGFKTAWLLWPDSESWPSDGEIDFPEGNLDGTINAFMHRQNATSGDDQDAFNTTATYTSWHTASIEWTPNAVRFILDDQVIGTSTSRIPNTPMHWVIQTESCLNGCPQATTAGNLQIAWVVAYSPA